MTTKEIVQQVIDAFDQNDVDKILMLFADDVIWTMKGSGGVTISNGKDEVEKFLGTMEDIRIVASRHDHIIVDGNKAAVDGFIQCKSKSGEEINMHYADFYELENDRVKIVTSYIVDKKD